MKPSAEYFGPADMPLFGWLHASPAPADLAVLLCPPLGQEQINSYRSQQALAADLSARGLPCLRIDYAGCGNSADPTPALHAAGDVPAWQRSIERGIDHLRERTGARRVALLALRSGALLAGPIAARHADVAALVAVAPVVSGRLMLREWRALQATAALQPARDDGAMEVAGAHFSAATCGQLGALALAELVWPPGMALQVIERDDLPGAARWLEALKAQGLAVDHQQVAGLGAMLDEPQHQRTLPQAAVQAVGHWLQGQARAVAARPTGTPAATGDRRWRAVRTTAEVAAGVEEQIMLLGDTNPGVASAWLFAILTQPVQPAPGGATLLLPNTGPVHHIGGHRLHVQLARQLAAQGHRVLRLDLSGLGDSPARPGTATEPSYGPHAVDDLALVVRAAQARWPDAPVQLLGLCAGGYHALRFAVQHPGAAQCFIVNPLVYHWQQGRTLAGHEVQLQSAYYGAKWRRWDSWQRLFSGRSDWRLLARVAVGKLRQALQRQATQQADDLGRDLQAAAQHGSRLHFIFADKEPGWPALQAQAGERLQALQASGQMRVHHLPNADHTLSTADARQRLIALVAQHLAREPRPAPPAAEPGSATSAALTSADHAPATDSAVRMPAAG